jgi:NAD(P)-dependent dehydrogenase (short-subunit alcohol dehydrogenase family)
MASSNPTSHHFASRFGIVTGMGPVDDKRLRVLVVGAETRVGASLSAGLALSGCAVGELAAAVCRTQASALEGVAPVVAGLGGLDALIITSWGSALTAPKPLEAITDADLDAGWEGSMQTLIWSLQMAFPALAASKGRVVVVLPTTAMSGGSHYSLAAATFEAQRVLMKAAARQWGPSGIRVNALAIAPESVLDDAELAEVHYLAPAALGEDRTDDQRADDLLGAAHFLIGTSSRGLTGQTLGVDGGRWLAP